MRISMEMVILGALRGRYEGDLHPCDNHGSGSSRRKFKNVSFSSRRLNKVVHFKAKAGKNKRRKGNVRRTRR